MNIIDQFLSRLENVKPVSNGRWLARCPAHNDKTPSLSIANTADGKLLIHCFASCSTPDIVQSVGLELADLFPSKIPVTYRRGKLPPKRPRVAYVLAGPDAEGIFQRDYAGIGAGLFLPASTDPTAVRWPVDGLNVMIVGRLQERELLVLIVSLRRDGAAVVTGQDSEGVTHSVGGKS